MLTSTNIEIARFRKLERMVRQNKKRWSEDDDDYLRYFVSCGDARIKDAAVFLERTYCSVSARLTYLRKDDETVHRIKRKWTKKEDEYISKNFLKIDDKVIARNLSRSIEGVKSRRCALGLSKVRPIAKHKKTITTLAERGYYRKCIAKYLDIDVKSLSTFMRLNNIHCDHVPESERTNIFKKEIDDDVRKKTNK